MEELAGGVCCTRVTNKSFKSDNADNRNTIDSID